MVREFIKIAWRNLGRNLRRTLIIVSAIGLGIWGALMTMASYNAFGVQMVSNFIDSNLGHAQIHLQGYTKNPSLRLCLTDAEETVNRIKSAPHLAGYAPRIYGFALAQSSRASQGVMLLGIDPELEPTVTRLKEFIKSGSYFSSPNEPAVLIGKTLAHKLKVKPGDKLSFYLQSFEGGEDIVESFRVKGIYASGFTDLDKMMVYLPLGKAQELLKMENRLNEIALRVDEEKNLEALKTELKKRLAGLAPKLSFHPAQKNAEGKEFYLLKVRSTEPDNLLLSPEALAESFKREPNVSNLSLRLSLPLTAIHQLSGGKNRALNLEVIGIDPIAENKVSGIFNQVQIPDSSHLRGTELDKELEMNEDWVILSENAAKELAAEPGDTIRLDSGDKILSLEVIGKLKTGLEENSESRFALTSRRGLWSTFISQTAASEIAVRLKPGSDPAQTSERLKAGLNLEVLDWKELWPVLAQMTTIMTYTNLILLLCIYIIVAFGIANTMIMSVFERVREFGILKAIGTSPARLFMMVVIESVLLSLLGLLFGAVISAGTLWLWNSRGLNLSMFSAGLEAFGIPTVLYPLLTLKDILRVVLLAVLMAILSALYPAFRASRLLVVEAIRRF